MRTRNLAPFDPGIRVAVSRYRPGEVNRCSDCDSAQWHVGRITAECARCGHVSYVVRPGEPMEFAA